MLSVSTAVRVCVGGNRLHHVICKYAHEMRENTSVRCKAVLQHSNMKGAQQSQTFLPARKNEKRSKENLDETCRHWMHDTWSVQPHSKVFRRFHTCSLCPNRRACCSQSQKLLSGVVFRNSQMLIGNIVTHQESGRGHVQVTWHFCPSCMVQVL